MVKSFNATAVVPLSATSVTVVIAIPVANAIPIGFRTFAAEEPGILIVKKIDAPAVGAEAVS